MISVLKFCEKDHAEITISKLIATSETLNNLSREEGKDQELIQSSCSGHSGHTCH